MGGEQYLVWGLGSWRKVTRAGWQPASSRTQQVRYHDLPCVCTPVKIFLALLCRNNHGPPQNMLWYRVCINLIYA